MQKRLQQTGRKQEITKAGQVAAKIHALGAAVEIAKRIKDPEAYERALLQTLECERVFAGEYQAKFSGRESSGRPKGSKNIGARTSPVKKSHEAPDAWCLSFGFKGRTVRRWLVLQKPEEFDAKKSDIAERCCNLAINWRASTIRGTEGTGEFERYTPGFYVEVARKVLGGIDLDPASCAQAQKTIKAKRWFSIKDDGLSQEWKGRVFLNPPYHRELGPLFIKKLVAEYAAKRTTAAILLTNNCTDTDWFDGALTASSSVCFTHGRVLFIQPSGKEVSPTQGQAFLYFGADAKHFEQLFCKIGSCLRLSCRYMSLVD